MCGLNEWLLALGLFLSILVSACEAGNNRITPIRRTQEVEKDADDPAIWVDRADPAQSLILGTDKAGILFVFDLNGRIVKRIKRPNMQRLNNVDIEYGIRFTDGPADIAIATDRNANKLFAFRLPTFEPIDSGGIDVFEGEQQRRPMGIAIYKRPKDEAVFVIISRKKGPPENYLWQYRVDADATGNLTLTKIRAFGKFAGVDEKKNGEIEAIAVDDQMGFVYYSDERFGIRKYHADPDAKNADMEISVFGKDDFKADREGIAIYRNTQGRGYLMVSDQGRSRFNLYDLGTNSENPNSHRFIRSVRLSTKSTDGCDVTSVALGPEYPQGLFVAMSNDKTFHYYSWADIIGATN